MTGKEALEKIKKMDDALDGKRTMINYYREKAKSPTSSSFEPKYDPNPPRESPIERCLIKLVDLEKDYEESERAFEEYKEKMTNIISSLSSSDLIKILMMRYIEYKEWKEIKTYMAYSESSVFRLHGIGLNEFDRLLKRDSK